MSDTSTDPDVPALQTRLTREYGLRYPFVGAGMGFIAHEQLAAAVTNAGGLGVLGASPDPVDSLIVMIERLRALTSGPFGVDLICADTGFGPASTNEHIDVCVQMDVPLVVFHHDPPPARWVSALRAAGIRVWMQASSPELASAAIGLGVDGMVAQAAKRVAMPADASRCTRCYGRSVTSGLTAAAGGGRHIRRDRRSRCIACAR